MQRKGIPMSEDMALDVLRDLWEHLDVDVGNSMSEPLRWFRNDCFNLSLEQDVELVARILAVLEGDPDAA